MYSPSSAPLLYAAVCNYTVPLSHLHPQIIQGNTESGVPSNSSGGYLRRVIYSLGYIRAILEPCSEGSPGCLYHMRVPTLEPRWTCGCYGIVAIEATMVEYQNAMLASLSSYRRCTIRSIRSDINCRNYFRFYLEFCVSSPSSKDWYLEWYITYEQCIQLTCYGRPYSVMRGLRILCRTHDAWRITFLPIRSRQNLSRSSHVFTISLLLSGYGGMDSGVIDWFTIFDEQTASALWHAKQPGLPKLSIDTPMVTVVLTWQYPI